MKTKLVILLIVIVLLLTGCVKDFQNCPDGGAYSFSPVDDCIAGVIW